MKKMKKNPTQLGTYKEKGAWQNVIYRPKVHELGSLGSSTDLRGNSWGLARNTRSGKRSLGGRALKRTASGNVTSEIGMPGE